MFQRHHHQVSTSQSKPASTITTLSSATTITATIITTGIHSFAIELLQSPHTLFPLIHELLWTSAPLICGNGVAVDSKVYFDFFLVQKLKKVICLNLLLLCGIMDCGFSCFYFRVSQKSFLNILNLIFRFYFRNSFI